MIHRIVKPRAKYLKLYSIYLILRGLWVQIPLLWCQQVSRFFLNKFLFYLTVEISEKAMATHSSILAWKIQWTEEPCAVHRVTKSCTWVSDFTFTFHFHALEKEMATHSSVLAWRIPGTGEPGGLPSMGSHRVGRDWSDLAVAALWKFIIELLKSFSVKTIHLKYHVKYCIMSLICGI